LDLISAWAVRPDDLLQTLNQHKPHVVHFSGHGTSDGEIILADNIGNPQPVSAHALQELFSTLKDNIRLVVLNACYSKIQAEAITTVIDCAIGMNAPVGDDAAIVFASALYGAIGFGRSIDAAFEQGKVAVSLNNLKGENTPELIPRSGVDPAGIILVSLEEPPESESSSIPLDPALGNGTLESRPKSQGTAGSAPPNRDDERTSGKVQATDPAGRSFLSYKRERRPEAQLLIAAQHDVGIPTWQDVDNLQNIPTVPQLREVLSDPRIANALLLITPEVAYSDVIELEEAPLILRRAKSDPIFFVVPIAAGGLDYEGAARIVSQGATAEDLRYWHVRKVETDPLEPKDAMDIATSILRRRVAAIHARLPQDDPLQVALHVRPPAPLLKGTALLLDWTHRFNGQVAEAGAWENHLLPALSAVVEAVLTEAPTRAVEVGGTPTLPAAMALGCACLSIRPGLRIAWRQVSRERDDQLWSIHARPEISGFEANTEPRDLSARNLAVLISVSDQVEDDFIKTLPTLPPLFAITRIGKPGARKHDLATPGQAVDVANIVSDAIRDARKECHSTIERIHIFMAVPSGLAMMIGQLMNVVEPIQTYVYQPGDDKISYRPSVLLTPTPGTQGG
jgi:SMODS-associated and fused to various effectors sensor domain/CHAT domain